jgi:hypothetical protein
MFDQEGRGEVWCSQRVKSIPKGVPMNTKRTLGALVAL